MNVVMTGMCSNINFSTVDKCFAILKQMVICKTAINHVPQAMEKPLQLVGSALGLS